ncbi:MAG TPA: L-threonylcarbamoyladenylate synthase [Thermodesulfovibrionales bacterium]|nr:L-threonylcarbamoyladenylate synthase [Thermodesulfovibrionales bacterium]
MIYMKLDKYEAGGAADEAISVLQNGGVIAYPTETFYGLGARFDAVASLQRLYELKRRPAEKAMPLIIGGMELLPMVVSEKWLNSIPRIVRLIMENFWPGPLTLLLPAKEGLSGYLSADTGKVAVRVPGESFALHLARRAGFPITATSANLSGKPPADKADEVLKYFGDEIDLLIDSGATPGGLPSTIVDASEGSATIVREGAIEKNHLESFVRNIQKDSQHCS